MIFSEGTRIRYANPAIIPFHTRGCEGKSNEVNFIEQIEVEININYSRRGALEMYLTSPMGTRVQLLTPRLLDISAGGFNNWRLLSVLHWGEVIHGSWLLEIMDKVK